MSEATLLIDPLAVFFRPALAGRPSLRLDATEIDVVLIAPLARVAVTRRFTNTATTPIEAVLTLPPAEPDEVVYGLTVTIGGVEHHARARSRRVAERAHETAIGEGGLAILHEIVGSGAQLVSIAGVGPGVDVAVRVESVRPLLRSDDGAATLAIALTAKPGAVNRRLSDADALRTTQDRHPATLTVESNGLLVRLTDRPDPLAAGATVAVDCARTLILHIERTAERGLDYAVERVEEPGGWEVGSGVYASLPQRWLSSDTVAPAPPVVPRWDWIYGSTGDTDADIRVLAPMPAADRNSASADTRAVSAFAAANLGATAQPASTESVQRAANVLSRRNSLAFIGPVGEVASGMAVLNKVALPEDLPEAAGAPRLPDLLPPFGLPRALKPGPSPLPWAGVILLAGLWAFGAFGLGPAVTVPACVGIAALLTLDAWRSVPLYGSWAWKRLPLLGFLGLPVIASLAAGPIGLGPTTPTAADQRWMVAVQYGALAASIALPFLLMAFIQGARRFTLALGGLSALATGVAAALSLVAISPGS